MSLWYLVAMFLSQARSLGLCILCGLFASLGCAKQNVAIYQIKPITAERALSDLHGVAASGDLSQFKVVYDRIAAKNNPASRAAEFKWEELWKGLAAEPLYSQIITNPVFAEVIEPFLDLHGIGCSDESYLAFQEILLKALPLEGDAQPWVHRYLGWGHASRTCSSYTLSGQTLERVVLRYISRDPALLNQASSNEEKKNLDRTIGFILREADKVSFADFLYRFNKAEFVASYNDDGPLDYWVELLMSFLELSDYVADVDVIEGKNSRYDIFRTLIGVLDTHFKDGSQSGLLLRSILSAARKDEQRAKAVEKALNIVGPLVILRRLTSLAVSQFKLASPLEVAGLVPLLRDLHQRTEFWLKRESLVRGFQIFHRLLELHEQLLFHPRMKKWKVPSKDLNLILFTSQDQFLRFLQARVLAASDSELTNWGLELRNYYSSQKAYLTLLHLWILSRSEAQACSSVGLEDKCQKLTQIRQEQLQRVRDSKTDAPSDEDIRNGNAAYLERLLHLRSDLYLAALYQREGIITKSNSLEFCELLSELLDLPKEPQALSLGSLSTLLKVPAGCYRLPVRVEKTAQGNSIHLMVEQSSLVEWANPAGRARLQLLTLGPASQDKQNLPFNLLFQFPGLDLQFLAPVDGGIWDLSARSLSLPPRDPDQMKKIDALSVPLLAGVRVLPKSGTQVSASQWKVGLNEIEDWRIAPSSSVVPGLYFFVFNLNLQQASNVDQASSGIVPQMILDGIPGGNLYVEHAGVQSSEAELGFVSYGGNGQVSGSVTPGKGLQYTVSGEFSANWFSENVTKNKDSMHALGRLAFSVTSPSGKEFRPLYLIDQRHEDQAELKKQLSTLEFELIQLNQKTQGKGMPSPVALNDSFLKMLQSYLELNQRLLEVSKLAQAVSVHESFVEELKQVAAPFVPWSSEIAQRILKPLQEAGQLFYEVNLQAVNEKRSYTEGEWNYLEEYFKLKFDAAFLGFETQNVYGLDGYLSKAKMALAAIRKIKDPMLPSSGTQSPDAQLAKDLELALDKATDALTDVRGPVKQFHQLLKVLGDFVQMRTTAASLESLRKKLESSMFLGLNKEEAARALIWTDPTSEQLQALFAGAEIDPFMVPKFTFDWLRTYDNWGAEDGIENVVDRLALRWGKNGPISAGVAQISWGYLASLNEFSDLLKSKEVFEQNRFLDQFKLPAPPSSTPAPTSLTSCPAFAKGCTLSAGSSTANPVVGQDGQPGKMMRDL